MVAFNYLVESHYRYYQFVANTLVAVVCAYSVNRWMGTSSHFGIASDLGVIVLCVALFAGARDALLKYYARTGRLLGRVAQEGSNVMHNGNHNEGAAGPAPKRPGVKAATKPTSPKSEQDKPKTAQRAK